MRYRPTLFFTCLLIACTALACTESDGDEVSTLAQGPAGIVPEGKADDFFSDVAREYTVTGQTVAQLADDCAERFPDALDIEARCTREAIGLKNFAIGWFLNQYVIDKHDSANEDWGGFTGMTRPESFADLEVGAPDAQRRVQYTFTSELSGPLDLLDVMPTESCGDGTDARCFQLDVPVLEHATLAQMETGSEWYRSSPWSAYAPELYDGEKETLELRIEPFPRSTDAFLEYGKLFSAEQLERTDGVLRIGAFVGWDYYDDRYDLQTARELYRYLTDDLGMESPAESYDAYGIESGSLTGSVTLPDGREVRVEVTLVHPGQGDPADPDFAGQMKAAMVDALGSSQIVTYEGHAGPLYGFALANWRATEAGELDDSELPFIDVPPDFYQVVLASGCDTYMVADALYKIPVKAERVDLDVITTSSFSNAAGRGRTTKALLDAVLNGDDDGVLEPQTYGDLLRSLNSERWMTPLFGVHGIDDNPRDNPFADESVACRPCETDADCGGQGNMCVGLGNGEVVCTTLCRTDADCGDGEACYGVYSGDTIVSNQCAPTTLTCEGR